ncbi:MAG: BAX inhibitor (BI)-1/YccA family protein [Kingella sp. (in: b-proteobacteria)]|nr:MAG: BAX inhibitor (BI)-1/YccA family protein [Kingella sp. (in: b-proteobacteria)]
MSYDVKDFTRTGSAVSPQEELLQKTYGLLAWSFVPCAAGAFVGMMYGMRMFRALGSPIAIFVATMAFFYGMCFLIEKNRHSQMGVNLLMVFTFGMGVMMGPLLNASGQFVNGGKLVAIAALMTAGGFFTMSALARRGNFNNNALGGFLNMGVVVLLIGVVANFFFALPWLSLTLSAMFVIVSALMIMWQVRNILDGGEDSHVSAALTIFISIYNLFSSILRLLLAFAGEER